MIVELTEKVYKKLHHEFLNYIEEIKKLPANEVENKIYEMLYKQEIVDMFYDRERYSEFELKALLRKNNLLEYLYNEWNKSAYKNNISIENGIEEQIENRIEIVISELEMEYISKSKKDMIKNPKGGDSR